MRIAVWDEPAAEVFASAMAQSGRSAPSDIRRGTRAACRDWLVRGDVDVALVPALSVLREHDLFDALPAVAFSSWNYPFTEIVLQGRLGDGIDTVSFDPHFPQDVLLAQIILKEHYGAIPAFLPVPGSPLEALREHRAQAAVVRSEQADDANPDETHLDLGREWFELTHYPLIWGVFVAQKGAAEPGYVHALTDYATIAEQTTETWLQGRTLPASQASFYREDMRYRLDDLATASMTALQDYLYYYLATEELAAISFYQVPDDDDDDGPSPLL